MHGEGANVVDPVDVIGVVVREENRVDPDDASGDELQPQLGRRVDQNAGSSIRLDERADPGSLVPRIGRAAYRTAAADLRNAEAGPRSEEREPQMVSTLSRLVVPCWSNGTPAVTMIRSPLEASSRATTAPLARLIISS